ncbi:hypothetical protein GJ496_008868, partial [Pomphorhynchus laevis]
CLKCNEAFTPGSRITEFDGKLFHPKCFACNECRKPIVEQFFPTTENAYLCKNCYSQKFPVSECSKCGTVIESAGVSFNGKSFHTSCFKCDFCNKSINGQSKISVVNGSPCCSKCFAEKFAKVCVRCKKSIESDVEYLEFEDMYWHKECFKCSRCDRCIADESFYQGDNNDILCQNCS